MTGLCSQMPVYDSRSQSLGLHLVITGVYQGYKLTSTIHSRNILDFYIKDSDFKLRYTRHEKNEGEEKENE